MHVADEPNVRSVRQFLDDDELLAKAAKVVERWTQADFMGVMAQLQS